MDTQNKAETTRSIFEYPALVLPAILILFLTIISYFNFLLFHTLAEFFAITIAILICVVSWNMFPFTRNNYLMFLGLGYFWIGILDLLHTMAYEGMGVISGGGANMAVQFWIGTRYLEAVLLLTAPWFLTHHLDRVRMFLVSAAVSSVIIFLVYFSFFPDGFIVGEGLTKFKIYSEYAIVFILALALYYLRIKREFLDPRIVGALMLSIVFTMCAELAFTFYVSVYDIANIVGHLFKILSFWLIFQAVIKTTLEEPFLVMSRGAKTYDAIPDATVVIDEHGNIREANNAAHILAQVSNGKLVGKSCHDIFHQKNISQQHCPICQATINREELKAREIKVDGQERWFDFSLSHITGATDLNGTVEVIRDISQRKSNEETIKELDVLKNSIVENLPNVLFVKDANDLRYLEWNKAAEELTGLLKEEALGHTDFSFWPKEQAQLFTDNDREVIQGKKSLDIAEEIITTKLKGARTVHTKKIPIYDEQGQAKYLLGISEDITDILKTQEMLSRSQKMEVVGQMSGGIAHDFNNQLGVILGYTELLEDQDLTKDQKNWLTAIKQAADRCAELTRQLLIFSRNGKIDVTNVDVNNLITNMEEIIARTLTPAIKVTYYLSENLWTTDVNEGALQDAILNLIINSHDAMPLGGSMMIETSNIIIANNSAPLINLVSGDYVQIMISDTGEGMSKEVSKHIFEPFYTTKEVGSGTGLGLSMVYGFVKRCGGDISIETESGKGSTFRLYLPRSKGLDKRLDQISEKEHLITKGNESILLVDDEPTLLVFAEHVLKSWGYKVYCAENAEVALSILNNSHIDLLFSDVVMPGKVNGYALAEKALDINAEIKVLLTSGYADKIGSNKEFDKYNFEFLLKPYSRESLSEKLNSLFDRK